MLLNEFKLIKFEEKQNGLFLIEIKTLCNDFNQSINQTLIKLE